MSDIQNATIDSTMLGIEDHGIFSSMIGTTNGSSHQGFGGYAFDEHTENGRVGTAWGCEFIRRTLEVVGVSKWEDLKGKNIRVKRFERGGLIVAIGHIIEDKWFEPKRDLRHLED